VLRGDLEDRASIDEAVKGAYGVFGLQNFWDGAPTSLLGGEREVQQGKNLLDAAKAADVRHFVQASVAGAGAATGVPHLESKRAIEKYARSLLLPATFLRPVFYMDNFNTPHLGFQAPVLEGRVDLPLREQKKFQMVAVDDIGHFTAMVFERPGEFLGVAFELASDELTGPALAATFSRVMGRPVRFTGNPAFIAEIRKFSDDFARMYEWINEDGFNAFIPGLRALHPGLCTFESFLRKTGWETKA